MNTKYGLSLIVVICAVLAWPQAVKAATLVKLAEVKQHELTNIEWVKGEIISEQDIIVSTEVEGRVLHIETIGGFVRKGDVIAQLDTADLEIRLEENFAHIARSKIRFEYAQSKLARLSLLKNKDYTAVDAFKEQEQLKGLAKNDLELARINKKKTERALSKMKIVAPFNGFIVKRMKKEGEYVSRTDAVVRFVSNQQTQIKLNVPVRLKAQLISGTSVVLKKQGAETVGKVTAVIPLVDTKTRAFEVRVAFEQNDWLIGDAVKVGLSLSTDMENKYLIPRASLVMKEQGNFVFRLEAANKVKAIPITITTGNKQSIVVPGALNLGDRIVSQGASRLSEGQEVRFED